MRNNSPDDCASVRFPADCERCQRATGMPTTVSTVPHGGVIVELRCRDCGHEWQCHLASEGELEIRPKTDRRKGERE